MSQDIPLHWAKGDRGLLSVEVVLVRHRDIANQIVYVDVKIEGLPGTYTIAAHHLKLPIEGRLKREGE